MTEERPKVQDAIATPRFASSPSKTFNFCCYMICNIRSSIVKQIKTISSNPDLMNRFHSDLHADNSDIPTIATRGRILGMLGPRALHWIHCSWPSSARGPGEITGNSPGKLFWSWSWPNLSLLKTISLRDVTHEKLCEKQREAMWSKSLHSVQSYWTTNQTTWV